MFNDDLWADVRAAYLESLEDGLTDEAAEAAVLVGFEQQMALPEDSYTIWLALAHTESQLGRLSAEVRSRAMRIIESGAGLAGWTESDQATIHARETALAQLLARITGRQPRRQRVRRPSRDVAAGKGFDS